MVLKTRGLREVLGVGVGFCGFGSLCEGKSEENILKKFINVVSTIIFKMIHKLLSNRK